MNINELISKIYKEVENIRHAKLNIADNNFTHYVQIDFNKNILLELLKLLPFKNIHLIKKYKRVKRIKKYELKYNGSYICNCSSSCICLEKNFDEIESERIYYSYEIVNLNEINNLNQTEIYGLIFNLN